MIDGAETVWKGIVLRTLRWRGAAGLVGWSCTALEDTCPGLECVVHASSVDFGGSDRRAGLERGACS